MNKSIQKQVKAEMAPRNQFQGGYNPNPSLKPQVKDTGSITVNAPTYAPKFQTILVERFREKLKSRGGRGMIGLRRQFKIMDDNNSGSLDLYEFRKGIKDFQVDVDEKDIDGLFKAFDIDGSG